MVPIRVMLVDDHRLVRAGVRALLQQLTEQIQVVAQAADGYEALELLESTPVDVILMDLLMPGLNGIEATARIVKKFPDVRVVVVSVRAGEESVLQALRAGAHGYLVKSADPAELELAVRAVARGEMFLSSVISRHVIAKCQEPSSRGASALERLTPRQRETLQLIAEGLTTKEIAKKLGIGLKTAETYRTELMKALDIRNIAGLTRYAVRVGLVSPEP